MHKDIQCIFCPYKKERDCSIHDKCYSLSNIYYGTLCKHFPFRQIDNLKMDYDWKMDENGLSKMKPYNLFMSRPDINMAAESLEELYTNFRLFVDGFCLQNRAT